MESSIKEMNRKITEFRREIRIKYEELDEMEEIRRKKIDSKRELQGLMRVRWSQKRKGKGNKRSYKLIIIIVIYNINSIFFRYFVLLYYNFIY